GFDTSAFPRDLTVALGSHALTPMEITRAYAVFANGGYMVEPYFVQRIEDSDGNILFEEQPLTVCRECENLSILESLESNPLALAPENLCFGETLQAPQTLQLAPPEKDEAALLTEESVEVSQPASIRPPAAPRVLDERTA